MKNIFVTDVPTMESDDNSQVLFPFSPPIYQTQLDDYFIDRFITEGDKLTIEKNDWRHKLAGNMKRGGSYNYDDEFVDEIEPLINKHAYSFMQKLKNMNRENLVKDATEVLTDKGKRQGRFKIDSLWINYQQKNDFNPAHTHTGVLSFVLYCKVPHRIFTENAVSNTARAGQIIFSFGEHMDFLGTEYAVTPYKNLMFMFPSNLKHSVPPFWTDDERISVSGNLICV